MYQLSVIQYPSGNYGFVGTIPADLCTPKQTSLGLDYMASLVFTSAEYAINYAAERGHIVANPLNY